jgi:hypothetical protein
MLFLSLEAFYVSVENGIISAIPEGFGKIRLNRERDKNGWTGTGPYGPDALPHRGRKTEYA